MALAKGTVVWEWNDYRIKVSKQKTWIWPKGKKAFKMKGRISHKNEAIKLIQLLGI